MGFSYEDFLSAIRFRESSGNYTLVNTLDYLGAYQFGEGALVDLGFVNGDGKWWDNDYSGGWTGKLGIDSKAEFLASAAAQDAAADDWFKLVWQYLKAVGADDYLGQTVGGIRITASGLIAGAHLLGSGNVIDWLDSGGNARLADAYGTPISEYIAMFGGYALPFGTGDATLEAIGDLIADLPQKLQARIEATFAAHLSLQIGADGVADVLTGDWRRDVLSGGSGDDRLNSARGHDAALGGDGNDRLLAGRGNDLGLGGDGDDLLRGAGGNDLLYGGIGADTIFGGAGRDRIFGGDGADWLTGLNATDRIYGNEGDDTILGGLGADKLYGGTGNDVISGGAHGDLLSGGADDDILTGGGGKDVFIFADGFGHDRITDFAPGGGDSLRLAGVASITGFADLKANHAAQVGDDVVITTDTGETLTLDGIALDDLTAKDFLF
ncbi:calcium-binding protein [Sinisalibacter aestuarii]|uniref:Calcium-binding protein n=1 Tax=Sinisalibacter aestuarii TaxID=2949426 RepID=A0ABQ5LWT7_9RHOB|nr:calcium-binding protein [Sinisalibacter aestuarii]GKY89444.1 hypothetical protein STA1M1_33130 [Sinisalibacter aestuarii]